MNLYTSLELLATSYEMQNCIRFLQIRPKFVMQFYSPPQCHIAQSSKKCILSIDASGNFVKSIPNHPKSEIKENPKRIFLYLITLTTDRGNKNEKSINIAQMLSNAHDSGTVGHFLDSFKTDTKVSHYAYTLFKKIN